MPHDREVPRRDAGAEGERDESRVARVDDELWHDRDAEPFGDEAGERAVVVAAEDDVQVRHAASQVGLGLADVAPGDDRTAAELAEGRRAVAPGELGSGLHEQHVRIGQHLLRLERSFGEGQVGKREVELAVLEQRQQVGGVGLLAHAHLDARPVVLEAAEEAGEDAGADALVDPDAQGARRPFRERGHVRLCCVELRDDRVRVASEEPAGVGQVDGSRATWAVDEALADVALELGDLLADGRLGIAELACRPAERARAPHGLEGREMPELDAEPSITFHDRFEV